MSSGSFEVKEEYRFIGRTFEEYCRMFGLAPWELKGQTVLDCPGGPSSFTAIASQLGATVTAADPAYGPPPSGLAADCRRAIERTVSGLQETYDLFVWDEYDPVPSGANDAEGETARTPRIETRGQYLRAAAERFLADYACYPGRYIQAALPDLPFATDAFDLVLSGNFLFLYDDRLDLAFHRSSIRELARISRREVRIFTLAALDRDRSSFVAPVVETVRDEGYTIDFREVPYEFQPGATEMLVLSVEEPT